MQLKTKMVKIDDAIQFFEKIVESDKDLYYRHSFEDDSYHLLSKTKDAIEFYSQCAEWLKELKQLREKRPHGKWERHYSRPGVYADLFWHCSKCGYKCSNDNANIYYKYCPYCGSYNKEVTND